MIKARINVKYLVRGIEYLEELQISYRKLQDYFKSMGEPYAKEIMHLYIKEILAYELNSHRGFEISVNDIEIVEWSVLELPDMKVFEVCYDAYLPDNTREVHDHCIEMILYRSDYPSMKELHISALQTARNYHYVIGQKNLTFDIKYCKLK